MRIIIKSDNNWYEVICYVHKKIIYSHIYPIIYDIYVQIILPKRALVHIEDENNKPIWLPYVSTLYEMCAIKKWQI